METAASRRVAPATRAMRYMDHLRERISLVPIGRSFSALRAWPLRTDRVARRHARRRTPAPRAGRALDPHFRRRAGGRARGPEPAVRQRSRAAPPLLL